MISQAYFDEVCEENAELFDLSEQEAVAETIKQLGRGLDHLSLTFPSSGKGTQERQDHRSFIDALLDYTNSVESVKKVLEFLSRSEPIYSRIFEVHDGFERCTTRWESLSSQFPAALDDTSRESFAFLLRTWRLVCTADDPMRQFQDRFPRVLPGLMELCNSILADGLESDEQRDMLDNLFSVAYMSTRHCEENKKAWMKHRIIAGATAVDLLLETVDHVSQKAASHYLAGPVCRFIANLCTFDDFRKKESGPAISSASANVQTFAQGQAVLKLHTLLQLRTEAFIVWALRAMAIHDEVVQSMVATGVLTTTKQLLAETLSEDATDGPAEVVTALLGFFRNVCANDTIKSKLCLGEDSIVPYVMNSMSRFVSNAALQEHGCGIIAAMALRQPANAKHLVESECPTVLVRAMRNHPLRAPLQRQAALAVRNIASRSPELRPPLLNADIESALRTIAGKHMSCQDEVYAALRDLGLKASMLQVQEDDSGNVTLRGTQMFGQKNPNFRPVFEES